MTHIHTHAHTPVKCSLPFPALRINDIWHIAKTQQLCFVRIKSKKKVKHKYIYIYLFGFLYMETTVEYSKTICIYSHLCM